MEGPFGVIVFFRLIHHFVGILTISQKMLWIQLTNIVTKTN